MTASVDEASSLERPRELAPGPPADPVFGHVRMMRADPFGFLLRCMVDHGDVVRLKLFGETVHLVTHPEHIRHVLQRHWRTYDKRTRSTAKMSLGMGSGLVTSNGDEWRRQRRLTQPAFHHQRIQGFSACMTRLADELAARWAQLADTGAVVDVHGEMIGLAMRVLQETLFGLSPDEASIQSVAAAVKFLEKDTFARFVSPFDAPLRWPTPRNLRFRAKLRELDAILFQHIAEKRRNPGNDLLTMLIEARDADDGRPFSDQELRDQVVNLLLAGYDTTAATLTWTFYLLSRHPEAQRRVRGELVATLDDRPARFEDLPKLEYTRSVIQETMRLYPAVWLMKRRAVADDEIGGYAIPEGSGIFVSPWATHRRPGSWQDPEAFDPTRFTTFKAVGHTVPGYLPFGDGPRLCIGNSFALTEIQLVVATLLRRFRLELVPGRPAVPNPLFVVSPRDPVLMRVTHAAPRD